MTNTGKPDINHEGHEGHDDRTAPFGAESAQPLRVLRALRGSTFFLVALLGTTAASGQQLLDRVLARVDSAMITLSDARAAIALGIVESATPEPDGPAVQQLIDRQVLLAEVARFPAPEPPGDAVDSLAAAMRARAGTGFDALMRTTGIDEARVREMARDTLRIEAYVRQRFGATATLRQPEVRLWLGDMRSRAAIAEVTP